MLDGASKSGNMIGMTKVRIVPEVNRKQSLLDGSLPGLSNKGLVADEGMHHRLKTEGKADARRGIYGGAEQAGVFALLQDKFRTVTTYGSRMVGGKEIGRAHV